MISQLIVILNTGATQIMKCAAFNRIFFVLTTALGGELSPFYR